MSNDMNNVENEDQVTVTLTLDNDVELECAVLTIYPAAEREYIALLPLEAVGDIEEGEVFIYRYVEDKDGNIELENIETDEEYEIAADAFDELLDSSEYDEIVDAEEDV